MPVSTPSPPGSRRVAFSKGHGTENDFVLIEDVDDELELTPEQVRSICDRRAGVGADGVLRVVRGGHVAGWAGRPDVWFMDYRNADGSIAEMCGNGVRVFVRYLMSSGLATGEQIPVGTRDGLKQTWVLPDGRIRVAMGPTRVLGHDVTVRAAHGATTGAYRVDVGNPHAVALLDDASALADLDLARAPAWTPSVAFPDGVNIEFVHRLGDREIAMRVFERGSGETRSCGTGTCAAVAAIAAESAVSARPVSYRVDVPGGQVEVELDSGPDGDLSFLTGPAVLVARGELWLGPRGILAGPAELSSVLS